MTYAQRQAAVKAAVRQVRKAQRAVDSALERHERELYRLLKRKTLIEPRSLGSLVKYWDEVLNRSGRTSQAMTDLLGWSAGV